MENNEMSMPAEVKLADIEEKKEQFEHEMTQVMLAFKNEAKNLKAKDVSEYLEMDIGKAGVEFNPSEFEVKGVNAASAPEIKEIMPAEGTNEISLSINAVELPSVGMKGISSEFSPSIKVDVPDAAQAQLKAVDTVFEVKSVKAEEIPEVGFSVPAALYEVKPIKTDYKTESTVGVLSELPDSEVGAVTVSVPEAKQTNVCAELGSASEIESAVKAELPEMAVSADKLMLKGTDVQSFSVAVADAVLPQIPVLPEQNAHVEVSAEISPMPDFTSYYSDIIDAVRAEL